MVRTQTPIGNDNSGVDQRRDIGTGQEILVTIKRKVRIPPFWLHLVEMVAAMGVGMAAGMRVYVAVAGLSSTDQAYRLYPAQSVSAMAISMTLPMIGWMLLRGHGRRNSAEMAAAMLLPAIPFVILCSLHVLMGGTSAGVYMVLSTLAMISLMVYRRDAYSMPMRGLWRGHLRVSRGPRNA
jgi:hypothetical protein